MIEETIIPCSARNDLVHLIDNLPDKLIVPVLPVSRPDFIRIDKTKDQNRTLALRRDEPLRHLTKLVPAVQTKIRRIVLRPVRNQMNKQKRQGCRKHFHQNARPQHLNHNTHDHKQIHGQQRDPFRRSQIETHPAQIYDPDHRIDIRKQVQHDHLWTAHITFRRRYREYSVCKNIGSYEQTDPCKRNDQYPAPSFSLQALIRVARHLTPTYSNGRSSAKYRTGR